jgi:hypothetical protein
MEPVLYSLRSVLSYGYVYDMSAISISFGLLIVLFTILLLHRLSKLKPQIAGYGSQRMCPSCGLITSRSKACCLECGRSLTAVRVTPLLEK